MSLKHISSIRQMNRTEFLTWIDEGMGFLPLALTNRKLINPFELGPDQLAPAIVINMREPSTGTRISFEYGGRIMGCHAITIEGVSSSSAKKGEPVDEMMERLYLQAGARFFAIRNPVAGLIQALAETFDQDRRPETMMGNDVSFFNAGEGKRYHSTQVGMDKLMEVSWDLFPEAIRSGRQSFIDAIAMFRQKPVAERHEIIAEKLNSLTEAYVGDSGHSRIAYDGMWLGTEDMFPGMQFHLVGPPEFRIKAKLLQHVVHVTSSERLTSAVPTRKVYMIRHQLERMEQFFSQAMVREVHASLECDQEVLDGLDERPDDVIVLDALPFNKEIRTIPRAVQNHPRVVYRFQAACSGAIRAAAIKLGWMNQSDRWRVPESSPIELQLLQDAKSLAQHQKEYDEKHKDIPGRVHRLDNGTVLDHIPDGMSRFFDDLLERHGLGNLHVIPSRNAPSPSISALKDIMFFPDTFLHQLCPALLQTFQLFAPDMVTNVFDKANDAFLKYRVGMPSRLVGTVRCTGGEDCIDNHRGEADVVSRFDTFGDSKNPSWRCGFCGEVSDNTAMRKRMAKHADD